MIVQRSASVKCEQPSPEELIYRDQMRNSCIALYVGWVLPMCSLFEARSLDVLCPNLISDWPQEVSVLPSKMLFMEKRSVPLDSPAITSNFPHFNQSSGIVLLIIVRAEGSQFLLWAYSSVG